MTEVLYRHKKRGTTYRILVDGVRLQMDGPNDMLPMVVYQDVETGDTWTRLYSEFHDGRFEMVGEAAVPVRFDKELSNVKAFHQKFGILAPSRVSHLTLRKIQERIECHQEEGVTEFRQAAELQDMALMVDALIDTVYFIKGTAVAMGVSPALWAELWDDVDRANMEKVPGMTARGHQVDVTKPPGWTPPRTEEILARHGYEPEAWFECNHNDEVMIPKHKLLDDAVHLEKPLWTEVKGDEL